MSNFPNISVANFAESLLEGTMKDVADGKTAIPDVNNSSPSPQHMAPDVSKMEVPASMVESITGKAVEKTPEPVVTKKDNLNSVLGEAKDIVSKLKGLLSEESSPGATTVGQGIGSPALNKARKAVHDKRYSVHKTYDDIMKDRGYDIETLPAEFPGTETPKVTIPVKKNGRTLESKIETAIRKVLKEGVGQTLRRIYAPDEPPVKNPATPKKPVSNKRNGNNNRSSQSY